MKQTEEQLLQEITRLYTDINTATYGRERANGQILPPNAERFYYSAKHLYEIVDELVDKYQPAYITDNDFRFIYDSQRLLIPELYIFKDRNKLKGDKLTQKLEEYLLKIQGDFSCILSFINRGT